MPFSSNEGARIHWRPQGATTSPPLVLLHSIGTDLGLFDDVAPVLERSFNVVRIDLRGHGASDAPAGDYSLGLLARDIVAVMDDAGLDRPLVCGISLGAMVAMALVQQSPDRVGGLALACTSPQMSPALWPERIATVRQQGVAAVLAGWAGRHLTAQYMAANPARVATLERNFAMIDPQGYAGSAAAIRDMDVLGGLSTVAVPTLVIAGERDIATPFAGHGERIAAAIPGAQVAMLPTGHLACVEEPEMFARAILSLADQCG